MGMAVPKRVTPRRVPWPFNIPTLLYVQGGLYMHSFTHAACEGRCVVRRVLWRGVVVGHLTRRSRHHRAPRTASGVSRNTHEVGGVFGGGVGGSVGQVLWHTLHVDLQIAVHLPSRAGSSGCTGTCTPRKRVAYPVTVTVVTILQWLPFWWSGSTLSWYTRTKVLVAQLDAPLCRSFEVSHISHRAVPPAACADH